MNTVHEHCSRGFKKKSNQIKSNEIKSFKMKFSKIKILVAYDLIYCIIVLHYL